MNLCYSIFTYGFALFSMFFGSGNLIFPILIGAINGPWWIISFFGLCITAVMLPLLGTVSIQKYNGVVTKFFATIGKHGQFFFPFFIISLLVSFAIIPRCITVAYGSLHIFFPSISLFIFSAIFSLVIFLLSTNGQAMLTLLGIFLSPLLLCSLGVLIISGIIFPVSSSPIPITTTPLSAFFSGFQEGYYTMDLFAALFFSSFLFSKIEEVHSEKDRTYIFLSSVAVTGILLATVYGCFAFLGAKFYQIIPFDNPAHMLTIIGQKTLPHIGLITISTAVILSCLTTAVALNSIYAQFITEFLSIPKEFFIPILGMTTFISFCISLRDFTGITQLLSPILQIAYPSIIFLTIANILTKQRDQEKQVVFYLILFASLLYYFISHYL